MSIWKNLAANASARVLHDIQLTWKPEKVSLWPCQGLGSVELVAAKRWNKGKLPLNWSNVGRILLAWNPSLRRFVGVCRKQKSTSSVALLRFWFWDVKFHDSYLPSLPLLDTLRPPRGWNCVQTVGITIACIYYGFDAVSCVKHIFYLMPIAQITQLAVKSICLNSLASLLQTEQAP